MIPAPHRVIRSKPPDAAERAQNKIGEYAQEVSDRAGRVADKVEGSVKTYPMTAVAGAAAVGFLLGALLKR